MNSNKNILIAPLNWGLGHATRCVPIIHALLSQNYKVTIASDGEALKLLKREFPALTFVKLPSYHIQYARTKAHFKRKLLGDLPKIYKAIKAEHAAVEDLVERLQIDGIISDNRLGVYSSKVPCVIMSHQLTVLSGRSTWLTTALHQRFINKFNECWVPDAANSPNLSGILGHPKKGIKITTKYIGLLSRMEARDEVQKYNAIAIVSGPEPQRTLLEERITKVFKKINGDLLIVRGKVEEEQKYSKIGNHIQVVNFLTSKELEKAINQSAFVIARSGYTTIMDLAAMNKKAFFIPTPGQTEQEYLAESLKKQKIAPYATQDNFKVKDLAKVKVYSGFTESYAYNDLSEFFGFFEGEGELRTDTKFAFNIHLFFVRLNNMLHN